MIREKPPITLATLKSRYARSKEMFWNLRLYYAGSTENGDYLFTRKTPNAHYRDRTIRIPAEYVKDMHIGMGTKLSMREIAWGKSKEIQPKEEMPLRPYGIVTMATISREFKQLRPLMMHAQRSDENQPYQFFTIRRENIPFGWGLVVSKKLIEDLDVTPLRGIYYVQLHARYQHQQKEEDDRIAACTIDIIKALKKEKKPYKRMKFAVS